MFKNKAYIPLFILPTILLFGLVYAASLLILLGSSFTDWSIGSKASFIGIGNYIKILTDDTNFRRSLINTITWIVLQSTIHVAIGVIFALILARKEFYWKFARTAYMVPNIISGAAMGMLFICILNPEFGAVNNFIRQLGNPDFYQNWFMDYKTAFLAVTMTWLPYAGVVTLLVLSEIASLPESIFESAKIDGASELKTNIYIVIPMLRNIIGTCVIVAGTSMVQKLDIIMMTTGGGPGNTTLNLPVYIYKSALMDNNFGYANTLGVFLIGIGIIFVLAVRKVFSLGTSDM